MTVIGIEGRDFLINGKLTYPGRPVEGLLMNSRMIQGIFDDENPGTAKNWSYPDTGVWDPDRNVREFCEALPVYRASGLLAVTVGFQGGGPIYTPEVYDRYLCSAFLEDGSVKKPYLQRMAKVLEAADTCGMIVIVNYFYWRQERFTSDDSILRAAREATEWLLSTGHNNILIDLKNEVREGEGLLQSGRIHEVLDVVRHTRLNGRRLLTSTSTFPTDHFPKGKWPSYCDFLLPHTNDSAPDQIRNELRRVKEIELERGFQRPIMINEDGPDVASMEAAVAEGISWGYYDQGYGCDYRHAKFDWRDRRREAAIEELSGFQTPPVNWTINTPEKKRFFSRVAELAGV